MITEKMLSEIPGLAEDDSPADQKHAVAAPVDSFAGADLLQFSGLFNQRRVHLLCANHFLQASASSLLCKHDILDACNTMQRHAKQVGW